MVDGQALIDDLQARGLVHDSTDLDELIARLDAGPITVYSGFDPTGPTLHIGHLVPLLTLRRFQDAGHHPIALAGGATGMIGDPGGRSSERNLLDAATLDANLAGIRPQLAQVLEFTDRPNPARLVDNRDWTEGLTVLDFLRDVGKHVTVNQMLAKDSVKSRVQSEHGISFTEFSYMLLQANDFWWLSTELGCEMQIGGSDQWGNITAGIDLIRRREARSVFGLTFPLITRSDGQKFGKSVAGTSVWLDPQRTSPYELYQYFVNVDDADARRFLLQLTLLPVDEIDQIMHEHSRAPEHRRAQRRLATELTTFLHGEPATREAISASESFTQATDSLSEADFALLATELPTSEVAVASLPGTDLVELVVRIGLEPSKGAARRTIEGGGLYVNDVAAEPGRRLDAGDVRHGRYVLLRRGKKTRHLLVGS